MSSPVWCLRTSRLEVLVSDLSEISLGRRSSKSLRVEIVGFLIICKGCIDTRRTLLLISWHHGRYRWLLGLVALVWSLVLIAWLLVHVRVSVSKRMLSILMRDLSLRLLDEFRGVLIDEALEVGRQ